MDKVVFIIFTLVLILENGTACNSLMANFRKRSGNGNNASHEEFFKLSKFIFPKEKPAYDHEDDPPENTTSIFQSFNLSLTTSSLSFNISRGFLNVETFLASAYKNAVSKGWCAATRRKRKADLLLEDVDESNLVEYKLFTASSYAARGEDDDDGGQYVGLNVSEFQNLGFDPKAPFYIITHGWCGESDEGKESPVFRIGPEFLKHLPRVNVMNVYWGHWSDTEYFKAAKNTEKVSLYLAKTFEFLALQLYNDSDADFKNVHLVGFSLGAQLFGRASYHFQKQMQGKKQISFLTALDPAGPSFDRQSASSNPGLTQSHAKYIDVIHTGKTLLGTERNRGDVDFWPNGGYGQPGCNAFFVCDHKITIQFYINTIDPANKKRYPFIKCGNWIFRIQECIEQFKGKECKRLYMGAYTWELLFESGVDDPEAYFGNYVQYTDNPKNPAKDISPDKCIRYLPRPGKNNTITTF